MGAGIAGLTAATRLQDLDVLVLEAEDRVGGRIKSERRGDYWVSVGAHMFPGPGSAVGSLVDEFGLETLPINGSLMGLAYRDTILTGGRAELYPFRVPMSLAGRASLIRAGLKLRRDAAQYNRLARRLPGETEADVRSRLLAFLGDRSFAEYTGKLRPEAAALFRAVVNRLTAEPDEISAGCVVALFAHVWSEGGVVLGRNLRGGASLLPETLAARLGESVVTGATVREVAPQDGSVRVRFERGGGEEEVVARCAIVTAPAPVARAMISNLPEETAAALDAIVYGPFVVGGIVTGERGPDAVGRPLLRPRRRQVLQHALQPRERAAGPGAPAARRHADGLRRRQPRPQVAGEERRRDQGGDRVRPRGPVPGGEGRRGGGARAALGARDPLRRAGSPSRPAGSRARRRQRVLRRRLRRRVDAHGGGRGHGDRGGCQGARAAG